MMGRSAAPLVAALRLPADARAAGRFAGRRTGDDISFSAQADAIRASGASRYTHIGIVPLTANGPCVIEAAQAVGETAPEAFVARSLGQVHAVCRVSRLRLAQAGAVTAPPGEDYGRPRDILFRPDRDASCGSELPCAAFQAAGLGRVQLPGDLAIKRAGARAVLLARWQDHPDCRAMAADRDGCRAKDIVTPRRIAEDPQPEPLSSGGDARS